MNSSFFKSFFIFLLIVICLIFVYIPTLTSYSNLYPYENPILSILQDEFIWPITGYHHISSPFGKRISPTIGASSFHKGIGIPAPEGTKLYAICNGEITFANFLGGGGYTITLSNDDFKFTYCHVSPNFLVCVGDEVLKGEYIGNVGPKNVYNVPNNPYKDKNGNPTNGATTGTHLHFGVRFKDEYINPMSLYENKLEDNIQ